MRRKHYPVIRDMTLSDVVFIVFLAGVKSLMLVGALLAITFIGGPSGVPTRDQLLVALQTAEFLYLIGCGAALIALLQLLFSPAQNIAWDEDEESDDSSYNSRVEPTLAPRGQVASD